MKITLDNLEAWSACFAAKEAFKRMFGQGGNVTEARVMRFAKRNDTSAAWWFSYASTSLWPDYTGTHGGHSARRYFERRFQKAYDATVGVSDTPANNRLFTMRTAAIFWQAIQIADGKRRVLANGTTRKVAA